MNSAASAKEAIRAMEAEKQERLDREGGGGGGRSSSRDRDARPRERSERGRSVNLLDLGGRSCVPCTLYHTCCSLFSYICFARCAPVSRYNLPKVATYHVFLSARLWVMVGVVEGYVSACQMRTRSLEAYLLRDAQALQPANGG